MLKPRYFIMLLFLLIGVAFIFQYGVYGSKPSVVSGWALENSKKVVLPNHLWELEFSDKMDASTLTAENVYIEDDGGNRVDTKLTVREDQMAVIISPPKDGYDLASSYFSLHVTKDIKSLAGEALKVGKTISFSVSDGLPVVGNEQKLLGYFRNIMKREESFRNDRFGLAKEESAVAEDSTAGSTAEAETSFSETNVQVQGVDEADIVKTDGTFIYQAVNRELVITKAVPSDNIKVVSSIKYPDFEPFQLYVDQNKLVVIGHSYQDYSLIERASKKVAPMYQQVKVVVYDITDKTDPKELKTVGVEGNYITSRKVGSIVYILNNHYPDYWALEKEELDLRPRFFDSAISEEIQFVDYEDIRYFPESKNANYSIISAFDIEEPEKEMQVSTFLGSGSDIYMSKENLYMAVSKYNEVILKDRAIFESIRPASSAKTEIYKFAIEGLDVSFNGSGLVKGNLLNQFSMDEFEGHFRIATTEGETWNETTPSSNHVFVLDENMKVIGSVEDLALGERIYSVRFMGEKAYVVTFKEVDPLFVLDMSNPVKPTVLGELKIPGFSNYLHPYDENHLIGFGQHTKLVKNAGDLSPRVLTDGVKISLFDVSNPVEPKEKFSEIIGGSGTYSPLNYDHKALLFNKSKNIFAFPITVYRNKPGSEYEQELVFQGALAYSIDINKGFQLQEEISHESGQNLYESWENQIMRVLYIEDHIYAVSPNKITAHKVTW
jgi:inhibitor of cysteine peptidase